VWGSVRRLLRRSREGKGWEGGVQSDARGRREKRGEGAGMTCSQAKGRAATPARAWRCQAARVVALRGEETG
jgi:hypothetical protein